MQTQIWRKLKSFFWGRLTLPLLFVVLGLWLVWTTVWQVGFGLPGYMDFYLHYGEYLRMVAKVKKQHLTPGQKISERIDGDDVVAERNPSGSYALTIITQDWDHAGTYGYVFSDTPLTVQTDDNYPSESCVDNSGDMPFVDKAIVGQGGHW